MEFTQVTGMEGIDQKVFLQFKQHMQEKIEERSGDVSRCHTISYEKYMEAVAHLKNNRKNTLQPAFRNWFKRRKGLQLASFPEMNLFDVLVMPKERGIQVVSKMFVAHLAISSVTACFYLGIILLATLCIFI